MKDKDKDKDLSLRGENDGFLANSWGWLFGLGLLFILMGTIGLGMLAGLTLVSMFFFGILLLFAGASHIVDVFRYREWKKILWHVLIAILYIYGACLVIYDPFLASAIITALLAGMFLMLGITRVITAITLKDYPGRGWLFFAGIMAIILGIMILAHWPVSGIWFIGLFIAIEMIINGWSYILIALSMRRVKN